jgi:two-component system chemotaxis response regulator CheY
MRTLIVEDTLINREFLKMIMSSWGECQVAESGERAVETFAAALDHAPFDVVFMDIMLPGIDGLQALERIRALEAAKGIQPGGGVKAIITTALDDDDKASRAYIHGHAISYITKPVRQDAIEEELRKFGLIS